MKNTNKLHRARRLRTTALFGFLWDFRERSVNPASYLYGFFTVGSMVWMIDGAFGGDPWDFAKGAAAAIIAKFFQTRHSLVSDPNKEISGGIPSAASTCSPSNLA